MYWLVGAITFGASGALHGHPLHCNSLVDEVFGSGLLCLEYGNGEIPSRLRITVTVWRIIGV